MLKKRLWNFQIKIFSNNNLFSFSLDPVPIGPEKTDPINVLTGPNISYPANVQISPNITDRVNIPTGPKKPGPVNIQTSCNKATGPKLANRYCECYRSQYINSCQCHN